MLTHLLFMQIFDCISDDGDDNFAESSYTFAVSLALFYLSIRDWWHTDYIDNRLLLRLLRPTQSSKILGFLLIKE